MKRLTCNGQQLRRSADPGEVRKRGDTKALELKDLSFANDVSTSRPKCFSAGPFALRMRCDDRAVEMENNQIEKQFRLNNERDKQSESECETCEHANVKR